MGNHIRPGRAPREKRQAGASERRLARRKRSDQEQIALLDQRPGESQRERARLGGQ